jgi:WS/DGAT/MGAT family acyltransferase
VAVTSDSLHAIDATFLRVEHDGAHMHVGGVLLCAGEPPARNELASAVERRLDRIPRFRQRLHIDRLGIAYPRWVDDSNFDIGYHVRVTALPSPGGEPELRTLVGRLFSQPLDRARPLWELWLVEGCRGDQFALVSKMHHCLVDGIASANVATVLFDAQPVPADEDRPRRAWRPRPAPTRRSMAMSTASQLVGGPVSLLQRTLPALREPRQFLSRSRTIAGGLGDFLASGLSPAPKSRYNVPLTSHRRFTWVGCDLDEVKTIKSAFGVTLNDVVLAAVAGALRRHLRRSGEEVAGRHLKAMVPVNVRADTDGADSGNRITTLFTTLPIGMAHPADRVQAVATSMRRLKASNQVLGADTLATVMDAVVPRAVGPIAELLSSPRTFNITITNIPGPQFGLYVLGRELREIVPMVPLAGGHALGIAVFSYRGRLSFGLLADYVALPDLEMLADDLRAALGELATAAAGWRDDEVTLRGEVMKPRAARATAPNGGARGARRRTSTGSKGRSREPAGTAQ